MLASCLASWQSAEGNCTFSTFGCWLLSNVDDCTLVRHRLESSVHSTIRGPVALRCQLEEFVLKLAKVFSIVALVGEDTGCVSYRDDMNLRCWTPLASPQARHCNRGLFTSNTLLLSRTLSNLCVGFLLYLLTVLNKPRRNAHAAIFPGLTDFTHTHLQRAADVAFRERLESRTYNYTLIKQQSECWFAVIIVIFSI